MRVLFLDDRVERHLWAVAEKYIDDGTHITIVSDVDSAKDALRNESWDLVSLDHDLNHEVLMDSNRADCGMEVVRWIVANKPPIPRIVIHSANGEAALKMVGALAAGGYNVAHEQAGA